MKELYELKDNLCEELKKYGKKELSAGSLDVVDKLSHTIKNLDKIIEKYDEDGYSNAVRYNRANYTRANYGGMSNARDGRGNSRRENRGRYSNNGYSYDEEMVSKLYEIMEDAPDDKTRAEFHRFIQKIEAM
ncbi:hypothetical protein SAMN05660484_00040 [Eubacterium ruminantium]|uniref:hypothetical protein n=1 Tax=Eubacterium ruminantium TaxID=42322 RepID=UPI000871932E|nr:hypothetical protein [Eubacterium ruminantium]SCW26683.1 hypothetical protein SAMN05660484_00040 [Eubacterium ruminantium]SDM17110.1 hypothetical protein SAMN04490370_101265 [Eubacterium ruminantium]